MDSLIHSSCSHFRHRPSLEKVIPKTRIYTQAAPSRRLKELFVSQISEIVWSHKLSPEPPPSAGSCAGSQMVPIGEY
jgi:hypothetical protein